MSYRIGRVIGSKGPSFRAHSTSKPDELRDTSGIDVGARRNYDHEQAAVKKAEDDKKKREDLIKQRNQEAERRMKDTMREEMDSKGTEARVKIKNVSRPDDPEPTSADSKLSKTGQIKTKIIDEEKPLMSDKTLGLPSGLIAAARAVMEKKHDSDDDDARKMKGGKTKVDLEPETDDDVRDDSEKKIKKTVKEATHPKTEKEKKLAALAHPKDKITHKDVLVGRGVLAKEEEELDEGILKNIKRGLQGWDPKAIGPRGEKLGSPRDVVNRAKTMDIDTAKSIRKNLDGALAHSPAGLQRRALDRRLSKEEVNLESLTEEELEEVLKKSDPAGAWIKDFVKSDNPKFAGKSKKKRMQMALGAYYAKQRNEEIEDIEEAKVTHRVGAAATKAVSGSASGDKELGKSKWAELDKKQKELSNHPDADTGKFAKELNKLTKAKTNIATKHGLNAFGEKVEIDEAAGKSKSSIPVVTKKIDFDKVKQVRDARKAAKQARHTDTSHLPPGWKTTWNRNEETDMELTDEELERLNEIAAQLDEKITPSELRAQLKAKAAAKKTSDSETKSTTVNESTKTHHQLMASYHERMASAKDISDSDKEMHEKAFQQHRKASVKPEAYSSSANKMTKALLKEEVELDEAKRGRPRKNPAPDQKPGEDEEHEHIIMQLRKVVSTHGALPVKHLDGKSTKLTPQLAQHALNKHNAMKTADQKQDFEQKLHKSHDSMRAALGG